MLSAVRGARGLRSILAIALISTACQQSQPAEPAVEGDDEYFDVTDLQQAAGITCRSGDLCSGSTDIYTSTYRVGYTDTGRSDYLQTFTAAATAAPTSIVLAARNMRPVPVGEDPKLHVEIWGPFDFAAAAAAGATPLSLIQTAAGLPTPPKIAEATPESIRSLGGPKSFSLTLTGTQTLEAGKQYGVLVYTDALSISIPNANIQVGLGALISTSGAFAADPNHFTIFRSQRRSAFGTPFVPSRFRPAGAWDVAFSLAADNSVGAPCSVNAGCASGYCAKLPAEPESARRCRGKVAITTRSPISPTTGDPATISTISQVKLTFTGNVDASSVSFPANTLAVTDGGTFNGGTVSVAWDDATTGAATKTATFTFSQQAPYTTLITATLAGAGVKSNYVAIGDLAVPLDVTNSPIADGANYKWSWTTRADGNRNPWRATFSSGGGWSEGTSGATTYKLFSISAEVQPQGRGVGSDNSLGYAGFIGSTHRDVCNGPTPPTWCATAIPR